jgi:hypothetical protein
MSISSPFTSDEEVAAIGLGLVERSLPKHAWNHAAHFAAAMWLLSRGHDAFRDMPTLIRAYNETTGVANTDSSGYHETITIASLRAARVFLNEDPSRPLYLACNALLRSRLGKSDWITAHWSKERLFSAEARRTWVEPDLQPLPF